MNRINILSEQDLDFFIILKRLYHRYKKSSDDKIRVKIMYMINEVNDNWEFNQGLNNMLVETEDDFLSSIQYICYLRGWNLTEERNILDFELIDIELNWTRLSEPTHFDRFRIYKKNYL